MKKYLYKKGIFGEFQEFPDGTFGGTIIFANGRCSFEGKTLEDLIADFKEGVEDILNDPDCQITQKAPSGTIELYSVN